MSREQWGHGYWKGVKDAQTGKINKKSQPIPFEAMVCRACYVLNWYCYWRENHEPIEVNVARSVWKNPMFINPPIPEEYHKDIYDYILEHQGLEGDVFNTYISGYPKSTWTEDFFVTGRQVEDETWNKWYKEIIENNKEGNTQCYKL